MALLTAGSAVYAAGTPTGGIFIDPGHSPKSPGTTSCSAKPEYLYNSALAKTVAAFLASKQVAVTLTHGENEEVTLLQRTQRSTGGALLLSLHHDSVQPQFLSRQSRKRGYCSKKAKGFSIFVSRKNPYFETSLRYATALGAALLKKGLTPTLHHAEPIAGENRELLIPEKGIYVFDDLVVLKTATSPAVLLEAAVIVNPDDDTLAGSQKFRLAVAESVYEMLAVLR
ncbi:N-acetylmuramoyl-L-alanine amidase [Trichlorobacter lovleyi]|uniref:N-acetylmuramoyl-L-alanine amidase n=1 Tax=Trichlorobacter lovleyi TaxID=313985 RepID=UPI0023F57412|nr:N-acetylmuramoyl-L-alanine amidase [Trichlorobacter lovleyi]